MMISEPRPRGRPRDAAKRAAIVEAARQLFLNHGLEAVKMDHIADLADVSKMTLYNYFADKMALFLAVVEHENGRIESSLNVGEQQSGAFEEVLVGFGIRLLTFLFSPEITHIDRLLSAELFRHPLLGQRFYRAGPKRMWDALSAIIEKAVASGNIKPCVPATAAEQLIGLWIGMSPIERRFEEPQKTDGATIRKRAESGVTVFMANYRIGE
jgi:TetR/AcrR family transcriptional regulator, mexJK operon transcriptional repressor